jgi:hypothetical protein
MMLVWAEWLALSIVLITSIQAQIHSLCNTHRTGQRTNQAVRFDEHHQYGVGTNLYGTEEVLTSECSCARPFRRIW